MSTSPRYLGKYELQERLGRGGMGEVWKALDTQLGRHVAIKILHPDLQQEPDFLRRFEREARVIASLHHPNIVRIHDFQIVHLADNIIAYMVMGYVKGQTLVEYIRRTSRVGKFPPASDILRLFTAIGLAVDYAHQRGIIHRDIKPANILLDQSLPSRSQMGEPILSDFGIVKLLNAAGMTTGNTWVGTPLYTSPEQAQGQPGDLRSDLYSLGVILYELCTGTLPFQGTPAVVLMQHITAMPMSPALINPAISPALESVIMRSLAKDPAARFPSASALAIALTEAFMMPVPEILNRSAQNAADLPTHVKSSYAPLSQSVLPSATPLPSSIPPELIQPTAPLVPSASFTPAYSQHDAPATPAHSTASITPPSQELLAAVPPPSTYTPPSSLGKAQPDRQVSGKRPRRGLLAALIGLLLLVFVSSGTWIFFAGPHHEQGSNTSSSIVGHAFFISSGQVSPTSSQGNCDQLEIDLSNIAPPGSGKSYSVWLLSDSNQSSLSSLLLGTLSVSHNTAHFIYPGDAQHSNLIASMSRLLVTEEDVRTTATHPSSDHRTWRYYAELPQQPDPLRQESGIDQLRKLLYNTPDKEIPGGADNHVFRATQKVLTLANNAKDAWASSDAHSMREQIIRILDYLDGVSFVQKDLPSGTPLLVDRVFIQLALISYEPVVAPSSLQTMDSVIVGLINTPGLTREKHMLTIQIDAAITNNVLVWLQQVRQDAKTLIAMSDKQLLQPSAQALLNDMATQALYSFDGRPGSTTGQRQEGVVWIHNAIQRLATFDITTNLPKNL